MVRSTILAALCTAAVGVSAAPAFAAGDGSLTGVCGTTGDAHELVTRSGKGASCVAGRKLMRGWRNAHNPSRYRGFNCGEVEGAHVGFTRDARWFATWQCRDGGVKYRIWTAL